VTLSLKTCGKSPVRHIPVEQKPHISAGLSSPPGAEIGGLAVRLLLDQRPILRRVVESLEDRLQRNLKVLGELDWIVMKALEKDRARRYDTPSGLARDIERHLAGDPVEAGPPSRIYRLRKLVQRDRTGLLTALAFLSLLAVFLVIAALMMARSARMVAMQRELAVHARLEAERAHRAEAAAREATERANKLGPR
jgi:hypothetical protein